MKSRLIVLTVCLLVFLSHVAFPETGRKSRASTTAEPHSWPYAFVNASQPDEIIARLSTFQPAIPLGPVEVLKGYEESMTLIAQRLSAELTSISQANRANEITRDEAEYLIQDRYQIAIMQREVLGALHDSLQHDLALAAKHPGRASQSDTAVVAQPPLSGQGQTQ